MKIAVYTAIFGKKDKLREPLFYQRDVKIDYFLFTDNLEATSNIYQVLYVSPQFQDITKNARFYKILGAPELDSYDLLIWHDGNLQLIHNSIAELANVITIGLMASFMHPIRSCVYEESIACIRRGKDHPGKIFKQIHGYFRNGMPVRNGLLETSILVKTNNGSLKQFLSSWWTEIENKSRRDQISLAYLLWKYKISIEIIPGSREKNNFSKFQSHLYQGYSVDGLIQRKHSRLYKLTFIFLIKILKIFQQIN